MNAVLANVVITAFVAFCRIGGCFLLMPGLSSARVPIQIRLFVAIGVTGALLIHLWDQIAPHASRNPAVLLALIVSETLIGALIGLMARLYVLALQFIASAIAMLIGFGGTSGAGHRRARSAGGARLARFRFRRCCCCSCSTSITRSSRRW